MTAPFGWLQIVRLGLVQTALGAVVVLTTSTLNRVMVVELALPALVPGLLVALHHASQMLRPRWGFGSDRGGRRTPWIVGGMAVLCVGGVAAAVATVVMGASLPLGIALGVLAFLMIGVGVGACGTNLLVLLAGQVGEGRRAAAATVVWVMMIAGFVVTGGLAGHLLDPFSPERLVAVACGVSGVAFVVALFAVRGLEPERSPAAREAAERAARTPFREALKTIWAEDEARRFTLFVLASMLAYSMQDLILEPFAGLVFGMTAGETTRLAGLQNAGTLAGMIGVALLSGAFGETPRGLLRRWIVAGCLASAAALAAIASAGLTGSVSALRPAVFALGLGNGAFAVAAIGSMMGLAGRGDQATRGARMGLWGAAQAIGFGFGGLLGAVAADLARAAFGAAQIAYPAVFLADAALFAVCAVFALRLGGEARPAANTPALKPRGSRMFGVTS